MLYKTAKLSPVVCPVLFLAALSSCVDHDYDLSKNIDMTVTVGGEQLTVPSSNVDCLFLSQILNLESESSIKAVETQGEYGLNAGDYVLVQDGDSEPSVISVNEEDITDLNSSDCHTDLDPFYNDGSERITVAADPSFNAIRLTDDDITTELIRLDEAEVNITLEFNISYSSSDFGGTAYIDKGYVAEFDPAWTIEIGDAASAAFLELVDKHTVRFTRDYPVTPATPMQALIRIKHVDFTQMPADQGIYEPGHFRLDSDVRSQGDITIESSQLAPGASAHLTLETHTEVTAATIEAVVGVVDPVITVEETVFAINDVPDFLSDPGNCLDIQNPRIVFDVTNTSDLSLSFNGLLTAENSDGSVHTVGIGSNYGTKEIIVKPNTTSHFVLSRRELETPGYENIVQPELGTLINTIPDRIKLDDVDVKALPEPAWFELGTDYSLTTDYQAVIPLAFGEMMTLHYTDTEADWGEDLSDYSFRRLVATTAVSNTIPMDLTPSALALDNQGNVINDVTAKVEGTVDAGTPGTPSLSELVITIESDTDNIGRLDGVLLIFDGKANANYIGVNLNKEQAITFNDIRITLYGGVTINLN